MLKKLIVQRTNVMDLPRLRVSVYLDLQYNFPKVNCLQVITDIRFVHLVLNPTVDEIAFPHIILHDFILYDFILRSNCKTKLIQILRSKL